MSLSVCIVTFWTVRRVSCLHCKIVDIARFLIQGFRFAILTSVDCTPIPPALEPFVSFFHPEQFQRPRKGPALPFPRTEKPGSASFQMIPMRLSVSPPSFARVAASPPRPSRSALATPRSTAQLPRTAATSDGCLTVATRSSRHVLTTNPVFSAPRLPPSPSS